MVDESKHSEVLKIGFYSTRSEVDLDLFKNSFDIVCVDSDNYNDLIKILF